MGWGSEKAYMNSTLSYVMTYWGRAVVCARPEHESLCYFFQVNF